MLGVEEWQIATPPHLVLLLAALLRGLLVAVRGEYGAVNAIRGTVAERCS